jgi:disulfide bond formation protein DsbB
MQLTSNPVVHRGDHGVTLLHQRNTIITTSMNNTNIIPPANKVKYTVYNICNTMESMVKKVIKFIQINAVYLILFQLTLALLGSLFFSDVKGFEPCVLCWWQRIFMYSQIPIIIVALLKKESDIYKYTLTMSILGIIVSIYHNLLYTGIIKNEDFCTGGISCTSKYVEYFGFVTIPLLALMAFSVIITLSLISRHYIKKQNTVK